MRLVQSYHLTQCVILRITDEKWSGFFEFLERENKTISYVKNSQEKMPFKQNLGTLIRSQQHSNTGCTDKMASQNQKMKFV